MLLTYIPSLVPETSLPMDIFWPVSNPPATVATWRIPAIDPVSAVIEPLKNPFSVYRPKPGSLFPYKYPDDSPDRSPSLDLNCKSYTPYPVLSTISI